MYFHIRDCGCSICERFDRLRDTGERVMSRSCRGGCLVYWRWCLRCRRKGWLVLAREAVYMKDLEQGLAWRVLFEAPSVLLTPLSVPSP